MKKAIISIMLLALVFPIIAIAADLPIGLQKILDYNQQQANMYVQAITIFVVFLAGMVSFLAPCTLAIIPAYFSAAFHEKGKILKMTLLFFFGFTLIFVALGLIAAALGHTFASLQLKYGYLVMAAGALMIALGIMSIFNRGFTFFKLRMNVGKGALSVFLMGGLFAIGWSACIGPVLSGVLLIASLVSYAKAAILMLFYALGNFVPFIIISLLMDRYNLLNNKWISGKEFKVTLFGRELALHTTTLISGILLVLVGILFLVYGNTSFINSFDPFKLKPFEESLQRKLLSFDYSWAIALLVALVIAVIVWLSRRKNEKG